MRKIILTFLLSGIFLLTACENSPPPTSIPEQEIRIIAEWSGTTLTTTYPFVINQGPWVILWSFKPDEAMNGYYTNFLNISVRQPGNDIYIKLVTVLSGAKSLQEGNTYVYDKGTFYIDIVCMDGYWEIKVIGQ